MNYLELKKWLSRLSKYRVIESVELEPLGGEVSRVNVNLKPIDSYSFDIAHSENGEGEEIERKFKGVIGILLEIANGSTSSKAIVRKLKGGFEAVEAHRYKDWDRVRFYKIERKEYEGAKSEVLGEGANTAEAWDDALTNIINRISEAGYISYSSLEGEYY